VSASYPLLISDERLIFTRDSLAVRSTYHFAAGGQADERRGGTNGGSAGSGHAERETVAPRRRRAAGCGTTAPPQQPRMQARTRTRRVLIPIPLRVSVALCRRMCPSSSNSPLASTPSHTASLPSRVDTISRLGRMRCETAGCIVVFLAGRRRTYLATYLVLRGFIIDRTIT